MARNDEDTGAPPHSRYPRIIAPFASRSRWGINHRERAPSLVRRCVLIFRYVAVSGSPRRAPTKRKRFSPRALSRSIDQVYLDTGGGEAVKLIGYHENKKKEQNSKCNLNVRGRGCAFTSRNATPVERCAISKRRRYFRIGQSNRS